MKKLVYVVQIPCDLIKNLRVITERADVSDVYEHVYINTTWSILLLVETVNPWPCVTFPRQF